MQSFSSWLRSWRLLSWRTALVVAVLFYTLFGFLGVPWIAKRLAVDQVAERLGRELTIERIECNPFALTLDVQGISLPDRPGSTLLSVDRVYANLQASSLFRWALTLKELSVETPYLGLRRFEDEEINALEILEDLRASADPDKEPGRLPRAIFQTVRVSGGMLEVEDRAAEEPKLWRWAPLDVELHDIATLPDQEGDKDLTLGLPEGGLMHVAGTLVIDPFHLEGSLEIDGARIENLWRAIEEKFRFDLSGGVLSAEIGYEVSIREDRLHLQVADATARVRDLEIAEYESGDQFFRAGNVAITAIDLTWPEQTISADSIVVDGAFAEAWLEADGTPSWEAWVPEKTRDEVVEAYKFVEQRVDFDAALGRFELRNAQAAFEDRTLSPAKKTRIVSAEVAVTDISTDPGSSWGLDATATLEGDAVATASGTFSAQPLGLDAQVGIENLDLSQFQGYVAKAAPLDLGAGIFSSSGRARFQIADGDKEAGFTGELAVAGLDLDETVTNGKLLGWGDLKMAGVEAALFPISVTVDKIDIHEAGLEIAVAEDGTINLLEFFREMGERRAAKAQAGSAAKSELPTARVTSLELHDCYGRYTDATTATPFERLLDTVDGTITQVTTDGSTAAELEVAAAIDSGGTVRVSGSLYPFDYKRFTDLELDVRDSYLPPMSPLSIKAIGFPIDNGRAHLEGTYDVESSQLTSTNHVEIDNLRLGEKVEGQGDVKLPIKLGIALLKDKNGRITLDVPISGDLDDPDFAVKSAVAAAATDLVGEIAKSPFRLMARLGGGSSDQNLQVVTFEAGASELDPQVQQNLDTLAAALEERPSLALDIEGTVDMEADRLGLQQRLLLESLTVERLEDVSTEQLMELVGEQSSAADVEALRQQTGSDGSESPADDAAFRQALLDQLLAAQQVDASRILALGAERAEAIRGHLVAAGSIDPARIQILPETAQTTSGEERVGCQLTLTAS